MIKKTYHWPICCAHHHSNMVDGSDMVDVVVVDDVVVALENKHVNVSCQWKVTQHSVLKGT